MEGGGELWKHSQGEGIPLISRWATEGAGAGAGGEYEWKEDRPLVLFHFGRDLSSFKCQSCTTAYLHDDSEFLRVDWRPEDILDLAGNAQAPTVAKGRRLSAEGAGQEHQGRCLGGGGPGAAP